MLRTCYIKSLQQQDTEFSLERICISYREQFFNYKIVNLNLLHYSANIETNLTESPGFSLRLHSEGRRLVDHAPFKPRSVGPDLGRLGRSDLDLEGTLSDVLLAECDVDDVLALGEGDVYAIVCPLLRLRLGHVALDLFAT